MKPLHNNTPALALAALLAVFACVAGVSTGLAEPALKGKKTKLEIEPPQERKWQHWGNKMGVSYYGTFDHSTWNRAFVKDPWGKMMEIPLYYFSPPDLSYMLNKKAKFPKRVTDYRIDEGGRRKLIDLKVDELLLGEFKYWKNHGELGGGFHSMNVAPVVEIIKGRKGLRFKVSNFTHIKNMYEALTSDFTVTDYLGKNKPFTMSAWVYDSEPFSREYGGTVMSWHSMGGDHGTRLSFSQDNCDIGGMSATSHGLKGERKGALGLHPSNEWQHVTYVYTGGTDGELRIYTNGRLVSRHRYDNITHKRPLKIDEIGTTNAVVRADLLAKKAKASVGLYYDVVDHHHWFQQRHWKWQNELTLVWAPEGEIKFELTDLKPGTKYYYRIQSVDMDGGWWGYQYNHLRRWCYGPGVFVTATEDGRPGYNVPEDTRKHFFIGANWGSQWYYGYSGPSGFLDAYVGDMKLYDYAMDELEVRVNADLPDAFGPVPADDAALMTLKTAFSWQQGSKGVARYKVYRSTDREKVAKGTAESVVTAKAELDAIDLEPGMRYYWRVAQLDAKGRVKTDGEVWTFRTRIGEANSPNPEDGGTINAIHKFTWTPISATGAHTQYLYIAASVEALKQMQKPTVEIKPLVNRWGSFVMDYHTPGPKVLKPGVSYVWRVDTSQKDGRITPSEVWRFHVRDYVTPEPDSIVPEPLPDNYAAAVLGAKMMESSMGFPGVISPGADNDALLQVALGTRRFLEKTKVARDMVYYWNCGHKLGSYEGGGFSKGFMGGSYGGFYMKDGKEVLQPLLFHETGHQIHGVFNSSDPDFRMINRQVWLDHADDNAGLGGYNANNEYEQMAVSSQAFMHADQRYGMYHRNRNQYLALQPHMPGDLCIELDPDHGLKTDGNGVLLTWENKGGLLDWIDDGWQNMAGSVGTFTAIGSPKAETVRGVPAVTFSGSDALEWEFKTKYGLHENHDFAVEFWALKNEAGAPGQVLAGWGDAARGARFFWGSDDVAYKHCGSITGNWAQKPGVGEWHHIVHVFRGGGKKNGPGPYLMYVNGKLVRQGTHRFNLAENVRVFVAGVPKDGRVTGGFKGSLAHVRIYNYDISDDQIAEHFAEESPYYRKPYGHIAGKLYVDMDARRVADVPRREHNPLYPAKMHRPWLRSWANHGMLSGRLHNDIHSYMWGPSHSTPIPKKINGIYAPVFSGKDRMVSGFMPDTEMLAAGAPGTLEAWVYSDAQSDEEVVLEWGSFKFDTRLLQKGWQHVALIFAPDDNAKKAPRPENWQPTGKTKVYVNGKDVGELDRVMWPGRHERLHVGGHYDPVRWNWKRYFNGAVAALRIHKGRLTPEQIAENFRTHAFNNAHDPEPAPGGIVVAERTPSLGWAPGVVGGKPKETLYLGETPDSLKAIGQYAPGECKPSLEPGTQYYWRVGGSDTWGFKTRQGPLVHLDSADLQEGELTKWVNKGPRGGSFVPGTTPDTWTPVSKTHLGVSGMKLISGRRMQSTFDTPATMRNGPFAIFFRAARQIRHGNAEILSWGPRDTGAVFLHGTGDPFRWGKPKNRRAGQWEHSVARYPEEERAKQLATLSAMAHFWKSQCITYDGSIFKYYSDGRLVNEVKKEFSLPSADKLVIGGEAVETYLKELKVFSKALSAKDVAKLDKGKTVATREMLVAVTVPDQEDGKRVHRLKNRGSLKGEFVPIAPTSRDHIPSVKMLEGVKCAYFNGGTEFLESDKLMPEEFASTHPFTVEARVNILNNGAFLAFAPEVAQAGQGNRNIGRHVDFSATGIGARERSAGRAPVNKWIHLALVYDGGYRSRFKMYVDGELQQGATREYTSLATIAGYPMYVGACFNTYSGPVRGFRGGIKSIKAYDYVRTPEETAAAAK